MRIVEFVLAASFAGAALSCSLIVDVPADCTDEACGAYVCAADGIDCLASCTGDTDCGDGYLCNPLSAVCEAAACRLVVGPVALALPSDAVEVASAWAMPTDGSEQLVTAVSNRGGLGVRRFDAAGLPGGDAISPTSQLFDFVSENPSRRRFWPRVSFVDTGESAVGGAAFVFSWVDVSRTTDTVRVSTFGIVPVQAPRHVDVATVSRSVEITETAFAGTPVLGAAAWRQRSTASGDVVAARMTDGLGNPSNAAAFELTEDGVQGGGVVAVRSGDEVAVGYWTNSSGALGIRFDRLAAGGQRSGRVEIDPGATDARNTDVVGLRAEVVGGVVVVTFELRSGASRTFRVATIEASAFESADSTPLVVPSYEVTLPVESPGVVAVVASAGGVAWVVSGRADGRDALWLQRTDLAGQATGDAEPIAANPETMDQLELHATQDGLAAVSRSSDGEADLVTLRRWTCD